MTIASLRAYATVTGPTAVYTDPDGRSRPITAGDVGDIRLAVIRLAADQARRAGTEVELVTSGDRGDHHLLVAADGTLTPVAPNANPTGPAAAHGLNDPPTPNGRPSDADPEGAIDPASVTLTRRAQKLEPSTAASERVSFITESAPASTASGWRRLLLRLGINVAPSPYAVARAGWVSTVSRQWAGCRTIAVVNGKGGVGKTMTTAMLAAVYARNGGGNVLAWDNNDTRGTLGWRTDAGLYDTTVRDLLPAADQLLASTASVSDIARFVHHQAADRYDVLRSNPELLATDQRLDQAQFDLLMQVAARYYRLVVFDSGNDESADRWIRMIDSTHQLVIPTLSAPEPAESAALLLDALSNRDERSAALAQSAVVVVTQSEPGDASSTRRIADGFEGRVRAVETVPFDPALKSGPLRLDALRPSTRDAWLRVSAAVAETL